MAYGLFWFFIKVICLSFTMESSFPRNTLDILLITLETNSLSSQQGKHLSIMARVQLLVNSIILGMVLYNLQVYICPTTLIKKFWRLGFTSLFGLVISKRKIVTVFKEGGLGLIYICNLNKVVVIIRTQDFFPFSFINSVVFVHVIWYIQFICNNVTFKNMNILVGCIGS